MTTQQTRLIGRITGPVAAQKVGMQGGAKPRTGAYRAVREDARLR